MPKFPFRAKVKALPVFEESTGLAPYPFFEGDLVCVLGELVGMEGHYVVALPDGRVVFGYHDYFKPFDI